MGTVGRYTVFDSGTANRAGFLPGVVAGEVVLLVLVPVGHLYRYSRGP